jgi:hypothetical protein
MEAKQITLDIRNSQATTIYGPGGIVDFPGVSVMITSPDLTSYSWGGESGTKNIKRKVRDTRLEELLNVEYFVEPPVEASKFIGIQGVRFPDAAYCINCGSIYFQSILERNYPSQFQHIALKKNDGIWHCPKCSQGETTHLLVPSRFIIINNYGLIDDFPWDWFCHRREKFRNNRIQGGTGKCAGANHEHLKIHFGSTSSSIREIYVSCKSCKAKESLGPVFNSQESVFFSDGMSLLKDLNYQLSAPWKGYGANGAPFYQERLGGGGTLGKDELMRHTPRVVLRGAGNVFFPLRYSGFSLPEAFNESLKGELTNEESKMVELLDLLCQLKNPILKIDLNQASKVEKAKGLLNKVDKKEIRTHTQGRAFKPDDFITYLEQLEAEENSSASIRKEQSRLNEFNCFNTSGLEASSNDWFENEIKEVSVNEYSSLKPWLKRVVLLHKVKQIDIMKGFTRVRPLAFDELILANTAEEAGARAEEYRRVVDVRKYPTTTPWLPCNVVKGEGLLLVFDNETLESWSGEIASSSLSMDIRKRIKSLNDNHIRALKDFDPSLTEADVVNVNARYVLLHTLSHLLINSLSEAAGYNSASLSEVIYCNEEGQTKDSEKMNAILIYTSSSDSEGSLGGLIQNGKEHRLTEIFRSSLDKAKWCSSDPICIDSDKGQGFMGTNLAACFACSMVPETSCENSNRFLDRACLIGTLANPELGFFKQVGFLG